MPDKVRSKEITGIAITKKLKGYILLQYQVLKDGHDITEALNNGAAAVMAQKSVLLPEGIIRIQDAAKSWL